MRQVVFGEHVPLSNIPWCWGQRVRRARGGGKQEEKAECVSVSLLGQRRGPVHPIYKSGLAWALQPLRQASSLASRSSLESKIRLRLAQKVGKER